MSIVAKLFYALVVTQSGDMRAILKPERFEDSFPVPFGRLVSPLQLDGVSTRKLGTEGTMPDLLALKRAALIAEAAQWLGIHGGPQVDLFRKALGNPASHQSWCADFVHFCVKQVDDKLGSPLSLLYPSQICMQVWGKTTLMARVQGLDVMPGDLMLWQYWHAGHATDSGHVGIVTKVLGPGKFETIEGNTTPGHGIERDGNGVYRKVRDVGGSSSMRVKGFLRVWTAR